MYRDDDGVVKQQPASATWSRSKSSESVGTSLEPIAGFPTIVTKVLSKYNTAKMMSITVDIA